MGLMNIILGNASEVDLNELQKEFADILVDNEILEKAYCVIRDKWVFTNKRLILLNVQGVTGTKREYLSVPYHNISHFTIETAGTLDDDCELKIYIRGTQGFLKKEFSRKTDIKSLQKILASHILN